MLIFGSGSVQMALSQLIVQFKHQNQNKVVQVQKSLGNTLIPSSSSGPEEKTQLDVQSGSYRFLLQTKPGPHQTRTRTGPVL